MTVKRLSVVLLFFFICGFVFAGEIYTAPKITGKIVIDGKLNEWTKVPFIKLDSQDYLVIANRGWEGPKDFSAKIYLMWNADYLYIACEITDNVTLQEKTGATIFQGDTVEIYLRMNLFEDAGKTFYTTSDYQFGFTPGTDAEAPDWNLWNNSRGFGDVLLETQKTATGYTLEIAIPIWEMDMELEPSLEIGFDVAIDDVDNLGAPDTEVQLCWSKSSEGWANPTVFQTLILGK